MQFELHVYPKRGVVLKGTEKQFQELLSKGIIGEDNGEAYITSPVNLLIVQEGEQSLDAFLKDQWLPLWPTGLIGTGNTPYSVSGNTKDCTRFMKQFLVEHKERFNFDCIFISTAAYLYDKQQRAWAYTSKNFRFIQRELEGYCVNFLGNPSETYRKAKLYIEYVRRTATRTRAKRVQSDRFGRNALLGGNDGVDEGRRESSERIEDGGIGHLQSEFSIKLRPNATRINPTHKGRTEK